MSAEKADLEMTVRVATEEMHCFRCLELGIPHATILPGDEYVLAEGVRCTDICCADCFQRVRRELADLSYAQLQAMMQPEGNGRPPLVLTRGQRVKRFAWIMGKRLLFAAVLPLVIIVTIWFAVDAMPAHAVEGTLKLTLLIFAAQLVFGKHTGRVW